jgi:hypothetical protein
VEGEKKVDETRVSVLFIGKELASRASGRLMGKSNTRVRGKARMATTRPSKSRRRQAGQTSVFLPPSLAVLDRVCTSSSGSGQWAVASNQGKERWYVASAMGTQPIGCRSPVLSRLSGHENTGNLENQL